MGIAARLRREIVVQHRMAIAAPLATIARYARKATAVLPVRMAIATTHRKATAVRLAPRANGTMHPMASAVRPAPRATAGPVVPM